MIRGIGPLAAALVLTVLAHIGLPLPPSDPLRSTLVLLPLILAALASVGSWAGARGGQATPGKVVAAEIALLVLLVAIALAHPHLGLGPIDQMDRILVGGFVLLLAHRLFWLVRALGPSLGTELPQLAPAPFFVLPFVVYLAMLSWTTTQRPPDGDAPHYLLLTHSLAYDFDTDLRNNYAQGDSFEFMGRRLEPQLGDPEGADGELYSRHNVLMPLVLAPFYRSAGLIGVLVVMAAIAAATSWLTLSLARYYFPTLPRAASLAWAILAFTAPFLLFSYQVWVEMPAALLVVVALIEIHHLRRQDQTSIWHWALFFGSVILLPLLKIRFLLIAVPLASLGLWQGSRRARTGAAWLLIAVLALAAAIFLFNQIAFQNPLKYHDIDGLRSYSQPAGQYLRGFMGLFFDCAFGLFAHTPIWMLLIPAAVMLARQKHQVLIDFALIFLPYLILLSPRSEWFGGWSPPYRYGVVMLPLLALWLIPLFHQRRRAASDWMIAILLVGTAVLTTLWLAVPGWTFNLAHGRSHLLDLLSTQIAADVARFFPSSTRLRVATYLWPPVAIVVMAALWRRWSSRPSHRPALWGVVAVLLAPAVLVWSAQNRTTRIVEFEDPWIAQQEGSVYPGLWVVYRPQYRGGWALHDGGKVSLPATAGGDLLDLEIDLQLGPEDGTEGILEVGDSKGRVLRRATSHQFGEWTTLSFSGLPWNAEEPLTLTFHGTRKPRSQATYSAILDRARLSWR